jgi:hypothetical protein
MGQGYKWEYTGCITATAMSRVVAGGACATATSASAAIDISITAAPDVPILKIANVADAGGCCDTKTLKFYAAGSTYFEVYSRDFIGGSWDTWSLYMPNAGDQSYTFTGIDQTVSHQFYVIAYNATGSSTSNTITTYPCVYNITISPNPVSLNTTLQIAADQSFLINTVTIVNTQTGNLAAQLSFDGTASSVNIDLSSYQLASGVYAITAYAANTFNPEGCSSFGGTLTASTLMQTAY